MVVTGPLAVYSQGQSDQVSWINRPGLQTLVNLVTFLGGSLLTLVPMLVLAGLGLTVGAGRTRVDLRWLLVTWILLPPALLISISLAHPLYLFRYVLYCIPPVALLAGIGLARIRLRAALPVGLAVVLLGYPAQRDARTITAKADDLRALADILSAHERPGDAVVFHHVSYQRITVAYPDAFAPLQNPAFGKSAYQIHNLEPSDTNAATFRRRLSTFDRVWYIDNTTTFIGPLDSVKKQLVRRSGAFTQVKRWKYQGGALYLFERK
jgi:mannosyltransferase